MKTILVMVQVKGDGAICHHECPYLRGSSQNIRCNLFHRGLYTGAAFPKRVEACIDGEKHAAGVLKPDPPTDRAAWEALSPAQQEQYLDRYAAMGPDAPYNSILSAILELRHGSGVLKPDP